MAYWGFTKDFDILIAQIASLEDEVERLKGGGCRHNCQQERPAYNAGQDNPKLPYHQWIKERE